MSQEDSTDGTTSRNLCASTQILERALDVSDTAGGKHENVLVRQ